jgi:hypothetical protein
MGWGIKWEWGAPKALRLRLAMHLFVAYNLKSFFYFRNEGSVPRFCLHLSLWLWLSLD